MSCYNGETFIEKKTIGVLNKLKVKFKQNCSSAEIANKHANAAF